MNIDTRNGDASLAYALLRLVLGVNILMHGISRLYAGAPAFAIGLSNEFQKAPLPAWSVYAFGLVVPYMEAILGVLLALGLAMRYACVFGMLLLAALTFGSAFIQDWNAAGIQLLYALIYAALLALLRHNRISIDGWLKARNEPR